MSFSIEQRLRAAMRRLRGSRALVVAASAAALPYVRGRDGVHVVVAEYYGMLAGRAFASDHDAATDYFRRGWKLGIVPSPFLDASDARFSIFAALRLRNALARLAWDGRTNVVLRPSRFVDREALNERYAAQRSKGGWLGRLMTLPVLERDRLPLRISQRSLDWRQLLQESAKYIETVNYLATSSIFDIDYYTSQINGAIPLSVYGAIDDYFANGELDGRSPNPFFEAEWHLERDPSQRRTGRAINQLFEFVRRGELGQASPQFWGKRYIASLSDPAPEHPFDWFTVHKSRKQMCPASEGVQPVSVEDADRVVRDGVNSYHRGLARLSATGSVLSDHFISPRLGPARGSLAVFVDERDLVGEAVMRLHETVNQSGADVCAYVIGRNRFTEQGTWSLPDSAVTIRFVPRDGHEPLGSTIRRVIDQERPTAWTLWAPDVIWAPDYAATSLMALAGEAEAAAAVTVTESLGQSWLRTRDALWLEDLQGTGVVVRAGCERAVLPDARLDRGLMENAVLELAEHGRCAILHAESVTRFPAERASSAQRVGLNAARQQRIVSIALDVAPGVAVAVPTYEDWAMTARAVRCVLETTPRDDLRVVVVDNGSRRPVATLLSAQFAADPRVIVHRLPRNTDFAVGSNLGAALGNAETVVFLNNDTMVQEGWLEPLLRALDSGCVAAQPLLLYGDRTVQSAGTVFPGGMSMPRHLLAGFPLIDVDRRLSDYPFAALTAACVAVRFADFAEIGGFDAHYVNGMEDIDLFLRLRQRATGRLSVCVDSCVVHLESKTPHRHAHVIANRERFVDRWHHELVHDLDDRHVLDYTPLAWTSMRWRPQGDSPLREGELVITQRVEPIRVHEREERFRWALKISSTGDPTGDTWGDTFFADDLAAALRAQGQDVIIDRVSSHVRPGSDTWDDVTLTLRGLAAFTPQPDAINLLWVISHPDLVTRRELVTGFDRIYAAGPVWADRMSAQWQLKIHPLLQATNADRFHPGVGSTVRGEQLVFVGRTRGVARRIVRDVLASGHDVAVYGDDGWEQFIDPRFVRGSLVPNEKLPEIYGRAGVVLNDHWEDMAAEGFFSNRLFDAAATGARIISDPVPGMADVFGRQVATYTTVEELGALLDSGYDRWPSPEEMSRSASAIVDAHSFDARARTLIDDVRRLRAHRPRKERR